MIKKDYEVSMHEDRSVYGVEWEISVPENNNPIIVAQDVFGELEEHMQLLIYPPTDEEGEVENAVSIRFNKDGSFAGVVVPEGMTVSLWDETTVSDWLKARDGEPPENSPIGNNQVIQKTEQMDLCSVVRELSDVFEAHAVHGDHSDAELQEWANVGRRAIGDYNEEEL